MPEGHTIHRQAREHNRVLRGQAVRADSPQGRFVEGSAAIDGRTLLRAEAFGKHLFHRYDGEIWLHVHLGLIGGWQTGELPMPMPRGAVRLRLWGAGRWWELRGAITCEVLHRAEVALIRDTLGPDPLRRDADPAKAYARIARSRAPIGALLMDQSVLAGVGNVYRAELLFRHGLDPRRPGRHIGPEQWQAMWTDLVALMREGVRRNRIDTVAREHRPRAMGRAPRRDRHGGEVYVYRRAGDPCLVCGTPVCTDLLLTRNLFWCPTCQPVRLNQSAGAPGTAAG